MQKYIINGGRRLCGEITIHGAKNSVLPVLAASVLCHGESVIHNCPDLSDVRASIKILEGLGCRCSRDKDTVTVDATLVTGNCIPEDLMRGMRSSIVFLGAIVGRCRSAVICSPGGCELGPRPIDIHLASLRQMGLNIVEEHGFLNCKVKNDLVGTTINLSLPSVGATENIILAAVTARGTTVIHNAAREPEIVDLANFLNSAGANISGAGTGEITVTGVECLGPVEHSVIPDRITTATYMAAAAITGGSVVLKNARPKDLMSIISVFNEAGCEVRLLKNSIVIAAPMRLNKVQMIRSQVYPGFPTDAGPIILSMLSKAEGTSIFVENIFENRYRFIDEINRLGANIRVEGKVAVVEGVKRLFGAPVKCTDLRGGAALVLAALAAEGKTEITEIHHVERGYEKIEEHLLGIGANIKKL